jgi:uncharacterized damage-inducible protein DinB
MAQSMQSDYAAKWANSLDYTLAVAEKMPAEDYGFRPIDTVGMTFGEQLIHLGGNARWLSLDKLRGEKRERGPKVDPNDKEAVIAYVTESYAIADSVLASLSFSELDEPVKWLGGSISKRRISLLIFDHATHHRAQAIMYLRLKGIEPPRYVGW